MEVAGKAFITFKQSDDARHTVFTLLTFGRASVHPWGDGAFAQTTAPLQLVIILPPSVLLTLLFCVPLDIYSPSLALVGYFCFFYL